MDSWEIVRWGSSAHLPCVGGSVAIRREFGPLLTNPESVNEKALWREQCMVIQTRHVFMDTKAQKEF